MKKRRSDIQKLVTRAREIWRQSEYYQEVKRLHRDPARKGFYICAYCKGSREVIRIDHIDGIGKQPDSLLEFGAWLEKLFFNAQQGLCQDCHSEKTKEENKKIRKDRFVLEAVPPR